MKVLKIIRKYILIFLLEGETPSGSFLHKVCNLDDDALITPYNVQLEPDKLIVSEDKDSGSFLVKSFGIFHKIP